MHRNFPQKSKVLVDLAEPESFRCSRSAVILRETCKPRAGYCSISVCVQGTCVMVVGLVSKSTDFTGHPLNSFRALASNAGVVISSTSLFLNFSSAFFGREAVGERERD